MESCPAQASPTTVPAALYKERLARARRHNRRAHQCNTSVSQELASDAATVTLECSICLSALHSQPCAFFERNMARTCDHCFHIGCAAQIHWDGNGLGACPLCRAKFDSVRPLPSLTAEPSRWFRCIDVAGEGRLSREQVTNVLLMQFPIEPAKLDATLDAEWPTWDGGRGYLARDDVVTPDRGLLAFARAHLGREPTVASHQTAARGGGSELRLLVELGADPATAVQLLSRHRSLEAAADAVASSLPSAPARACASPHATAPSAHPPTSAVSPPAAPSAAPPPTTGPPRADEARTASRTAATPQPPPDIRQPVEPPAGSAAASSVGSHSSPQDGAAPSRRRRAVRTAAAAAAAAAGRPLARAASAVAVVRSVWRGRAMRRSASRRSSSLSAGQWA